MMRDGEADGSQDDGKSVQVQTANQYYFNNMSFSQQQAPQMRLTNHPNMLQQQQMHPHVAQRQFHVVQTQSHVYNNHHPQMSLSTVNNNHNSNLHNNSLMGRQVLNSSHQPLLQQQQQHSTSVQNHGMGMGSGSRFSTNGTNIQNNNCVGLRSMGGGGGMSSFQSNKENLPDEEVFLMLRNDDDDMDLGQFQMSKSIYNQQPQYKPQPAHQAQNQSTILGNSNLGGGQKALPPFGSVISSASTVGGYFGFDRTNLMNQNCVSGLKSSPLKYQNAHMGNFVKAEEVYIDSNSQASLPTTVSSPASTISYFDGQAQDDRNRLSARPVMDFQHFDLNDDYWLEFAQ